MSPAGPSGAGSLVPASAWRRLMCIAYEGVLLFGVLFFFGYAFSALTQFRGAPGVQRWAFQAFIVLVLAAYFTWFWSEGRRTLPMKTMGVRLVTSSGGPVSVARALCRFVVACAMLVAAIGAGAMLHPALGVLVLIPFAWTLADRDRRALYDVVCDTRLVLTQN
jgi:uncharacterized RDD family membrane protein YckC